MSGFWTGLMECCGDILQGLAWFTLVAGVFMGEVALFVGAVHA